MNPGNHRFFYNPIFASGADPWITEKDGEYLYTHTSPDGDYIQIWRSGRLGDIPGGETRIVWRAPADGPNSKHIWAPEIHAIGGKWFIYYAADDGRNENHRMFVLESKTDDALGEYESRGQVRLSPDKWAIDGTILQKEDGTLFFIWSGWEGNENVQQNLYIARMKNPYAAETESVLISKPEYDWERIGDPKVNEGPQILVRNQTIFVIYSASGSWTDDYALGCLSADMTSDLLERASWKKRPAPIFKKNDHVFGPGHCSFAKSPDGGEDWLLYHAAKYSGAGWKRNVRMQRFTWTDDGYPLFGTPLPLSEPIQVPSGDN